MKHTLRQTRRPPSILQAQSKKSDSDLVKKSRPSVLEPDAEAQSSRLPEGADTPVPAQTAALLLTSSGRWVAGNTEAARMLTVLGMEPVNAEGRVELSLAMIHFCQEVGRLGEDRVDDPSGLCAVRRVLEVAGCDVSLVGVLLPGVQREQPRQLIVTMEWTTRSRPENLVFPRRTLGISKRENEVLVCLNQGMTNKEIATRLEISKETVKEYLKRIMKKTNSATRAGVVGRVLSSTGR